MELRNNPSKDYPAYTLSLMEGSIDSTLEYVRTKLFSEKTCLIYDHVIHREQDFPGSADIAAGFPDPCGYSTGMEDGMINGGTMLDACLLKYEPDGDPETAYFARKLVRGMLLCAFSGKDGFLPREVSPVDGRSHYPDSSRDQYTIFAFGMHRYLGSSLCTPEERAEICRAAIAIARRAERNVVPETGYDMLTEDGRASLVTVLWGDSLGNHEYFRLPMLYLLAYEASGEEHWLEKYRQLREKAWDKSLPMGSYWAMYTLQQMQASLLVCHDVDPDEAWQRRYLSLMNTVADYAESQVDHVREKIGRLHNYNAPQLPFRELPVRPAERFIKLGYPDAVSLIREDATEFFTLQDGAQIAIISQLVPGRQACEKTLALLTDSFEKIDLARHQRNLPLYYLDGFYRSIRKDHA